MTSNLMQQTKQIAVLRAIGYTSVQIKLVYFYEAFILVFVSCTIGILIGVAIGIAMKL